MSSISIRRFLPGRRPRGDRVSQRTLRLPAALVQHCNLVELCEVADLPSEVEGRFAHHYAAHEKVASYRCLCVRFREALWAPPFTQDRLQVETWPLLSLRGIRLPGQAPHVRPDVGEPRDHDVVQSQLRQMREYLSVPVAPLAQGRLTGTLRFRAHRSAC